MNPPAIEDELPERFKLYLKIKAMRDDDRSMPYIAKKLGFNNASSVQTLINTYGWVSAHTAQAVKLAEIEARLDEWNWLSNNMPYDDAALFEVRASKRVETLESQRQALISNEGGDKK